MIAAAPQLVTINVGGNDYLDTDGDLAANLQALIDTRATLQEVVSTLLWELPASDLVLNTVYDNEAEDCATSDFHARTTPLWNQVLRWIGTGQVRSVALAEAALDFAHQDVTRTDCAGAEGRICTFFLDRIHPTGAGACGIRDGRPWWRPRHANTPATSSIATPAATATHGHGGCPGGGPWSSKRASSRATCSTPTPPANSTSRPPATHRVASRGRPASRGTGPPWATLAPVGLAVLDAVAGVAAPAVATSAAAAPAAPAPAVRCARMARAASLFCRMRSLCASVIPPAPAGVLSLGMAPAK